MAEEKPTQGETPEKPAEAVKPVVDAAPNSEPKQPANESGKEWEPERAMATIKSLREQEKQWNKDVKELEALRAKEQARAEAEMTELEKAQKQAGELQAQNAKLQADIWRRDAATKANLPSIFADRIQGDSLEAMEADALKLAEALPPQQKPKPSLNATNPANGEKKMTNADVLNEIFGNRGNAFDLDNITAHGGGVIWKTPGEEGTE